MGTIKLQKEFIRYHLRNLLLANRRRISGRRKFFLGSVSRQVKLTPKKPDALEEIALLFVSSRSAPPHKEELCVTTSVEAGSLRKHPFLLALRRWGREERGETDVFAG